MKDTMFNPPATLAARIAPTESCTPFGWPCEGPGMKMLRGVVHDPTARRMGGVAGHAGLFSTAADLAIFCRMLLNGGSYRGTRVLSPLTVAKMTTPVPAAEDRNVRGARLGHRLELLVEPRRAAADRVVRAHRIHRHVAVDRSGDRDVRRVPVEPGSSGRQGRRDAAARAGRDDRRVGAHRDAARRPRGACCSPGATSAAGAPPAVAPRTAGDDRPRRAARADGFAAASRASGSAWSPTTPAARETAPRRSICCHDGEGRQAGGAVQP